MACRTAPDPTAARRSVRTTALGRIGLVGFALALGAALLTACGPQGSPDPGVGVAPPLRVPSAVTAMAAAPSRVPVAAYPYSHPSTPNAALAAETASAQASPRPSPTVWPTKPPPRSGLLVDGTAGRIYASAGDAARSELLVYDARDGRLAARHPLEASEVLLDLDHARRRLYLYRADRGVRLLSLDDLAPLSAVALPSPDPVDAFRGYIIIGPIGPIVPLVDSVSGQILTIHGRTVLVHDPSTGGAVREIDVPVRPDSGPVYRAALSDDGQILYLAVGDSGLADWTDQPGSVLLALDTATGDVMGRIEVRALVGAWLAWDRSLFASTSVYKDIGGHEYLWIDGRVRREVFEAGVTWTAYDSRRDRLVGAIGGENDSTLVAADASTLDMVALGSRSAPAARLLDRWDGQFTVPGLPRAYDAVTDQFYTWSQEVDRLLVDDASLLGTARSSDETPVASERLSRFAVLSGPADRPGGQQPELVAYARVTPGAGTPTPDWGPELALPVIRRSGDSALFPFFVPLIGYYGGWPPVPSPDYALDRTMFWHPLGYGVLRSTDAGRSWAPASGGLDHLAVQQVVVSPHHATDRTLLAVTFLGIQSDWGPDPAGTGADPIDDARSPTPRAPSLWRSRDGGDHWTAIGRYAAPAFSPDFDSDRTVMAFGYLDGLFHVSHDAGEHWEARGRIAGSSTVAATRLWILPPTEEHRRILVVHGNGGTQIGGSPHWPESDAAIHVSTDDGWTWQEAWSPSDQVVVALDSELVGPLSAAAGGPATWLLRLEDVVLRSVDGGVHWQQVYLPEDRGAYPLGALPDGKVLVAGSEPGLPRPIAADEFEPSAPPTARTEH